MHARPPRLEPALNPRLPATTCGLHRLAVRATHGLRRRTCRRFNRRGTASSFVALLASLSASAAGAYNFWFRFPGIPELLTNRWFLGYVAATFLLGMATSYYFDNDDAKLIDILCAALRLCGTAMLFYSLAQLWELALLATAALMLAVTFVLPRVRRAQRLSLTGASGLGAISPHLSVQLHACCAAVLPTRRREALVYRHALCTLSCS